MAEAVGVTGAVIAIATLAWSSAQVFYKTLEDWKDAPEYLRNVQSELKTVTAILKLLKDAKEKKTAASSKEGVFFDEILRPCLEECQKACQKWGEKVKSHNRIKLAFKKKSCKQLVGVLQNWKLTLNLGLTSHTWLHSREEITKKKGQLSKQISVSESVQNDTEIEEDEDDDDDSSKDVAFEDTGELLAGSTGRLGKVQQQMDSIYQEVENIEAKDESKALGAIADNEDGQGKVTQKVKGVRAEKKSHAVGAVANKDMDMNSFFG